MPMLTTLEIACLGIMLALCGVCLSAWRGRGGLGYTFAALALFYFALTSLGAQRQWLLVVLAVVWGVRHEHWTRWVSATLPAQEGALSLRRRKAMLKNALVVFLATTPLLIIQTEAAQSQRTWEWSDGLGVALFAIGLYIFEVSMQQRQRHWATVASASPSLPSGGLYQYLRHPYYVGGAIMLWSFYVFALGVPGGFLTLFGPLLLMGHLRRVYRVDEPKVI